VPRTATVAVSGPPASGKTTLAGAVADVLGGAHVSVGSALRDLRCSGRWSGEDEAAYQGQRPFPDQTLREAVQTALAIAGLGPVVLDGSVGLVEALRSLQVMPLAELRLQCPDRVRLRRFADRAGAGVRDDDTVAILRRRTALWRAYDQTRRSIPGQLVVLDASVSRGELLTDALTELLAIGVEATTDVEIESLIVRDRRPDLGAMVDDAVATRRPLRWGGDGSAISEPTLLLVKPGLGAQRSTFDAVVYRLSVAGYWVREACVWPTVLEDTVRRVVAHHGGHYVHARWASRTCPPLGDDRRRTVGYLETTDGSDQTAWARDLARRSRRKAAHEVWVDLHGPLAVVNSHVPGVIAGWFSRGEDAAVALSVVHHPSVPPLHQRRPEILGPPNPALAAPTTLRGAAARGALSFKRHPSHENNGFHVSDGAASSYRERRLWMGTRP
jgi:adenylate kinase family enzyme